MSVKSTAIVATVVAIAASVPFAASTQQSDFQGPRTGLSGLELSVDRILDNYGFVDVDPTTLDLSTLVEIIDVERNDEERAGTTRGGIQAALNR